MLGHPILRHSDLGDSVLPLTSAAFVAFEAEVLKVVDALSVHELDEFVDGPAVMFAQVALGRDVVVLSGAACEPLLLGTTFGVTLKRFRFFKCKRRTSLRQAARQDSLVAVKIKALSRPLSILLGTRSNVQGRLHTFSAQSSQSITRQIHSISDKEKRKRNERDKNRFR